MLFIMYCILTFIISSGDFLYFIGNNSNVLINLEVLWVNPWFITYLPFIIILLRFKLYIIIIILHEILDTVILSYNFYYILIPINVDNYLLSNPINSVHPLLLYSFLNLLASFYFVNSKSALFLYSKLIGLSVIIISVSAILGSWWAFQEGTWGGWWDWDPSENLILIMVFSPIIIYHFKLKLSCSFYKLYFLISYLSVVLLIYLLKIFFVFSKHNFGETSIFFFNPFIFWVIFLLTVLYILRYLISFLNRIGCKKYNLDLTIFITFIFIIIYILAITTIYIWNYVLYSIMLFFLVNIYTTFFMFLKYPRLAPLLLNPSLVFILSSPYSSNKAFLIHNLIVFSYITLSYTFLNLGYSEVLKSSNCYLNNYLNYLSFANYAGIFQNNLGSYSHAILSASIDFTNQKAFNRSFTTYKFVYNNNIYSINTYKSEFLNKNIIFIFLMFIVIFINKKKPIY